MYGSDQAASIEVEALPQFIKSIRTVETALGSGVKELSPKEKEVREKLRVVIDS